RSDVQAEVLDEPDIDNGGHQNRENHLELGALDKRLLRELRVPPGSHKTCPGGYAHQEPDVEREIAGLRPVPAPSRADAIAVKDDQRAEQENDGRDTHFDRPNGRGRLLAVVLHIYPGPAAGRARRSVS